MKMKRCVEGVLFLVAAVVCSTSLLGQTFIWTQTSAPNKYWSGITTSADGTKLAACFKWGGGGVYFSTNAGGVWTKATPPSVSNPWLYGDGLNCIASTADGKKVVVGSDNTQYSYTNSGFIFMSTNAGNTWTKTIAPWADWFSIALSSDGTTLAAAGVNGVWKSDDGGLTGTFYSQHPNPNGQWKSVVLSTNGSVLAASDMIQIFISTNAAVYPWSLTKASSSQWSAIASSADGKKLVAGNAMFTGRIYISTNSGSTWTQTSVPSNYWWTAIASSADGTKLAASSTSGNFYTTTNSGLTWTSNSFPIYVNALASSPDGTKLYVGFYNGGISVGQLIVPAQNFSANVRDSGVRLQFNGAPNCSYTLWATTNLTSSSSWQAVITNSTDSNGSWLFTDTNASLYSQRFYTASQ
jgi:hypothetical protein